MNRTTRWDSNRELARQAAALIGLTAILFVGGCPPATPEPNDPATGDTVFNNTTDRTNQGASYIGSAACRACHPDLSAEQIVHGHAQALSRIDDGGPVFPSEGEWAGGIEPPDGTEWTDIAYVIDGYIRGALFVDTDGYVMTDELSGANTLWNLAVPSLSIPAGHAAYNSGPSPADPLPYDYDCFVCHTTGAVAFDAEDPAFQDSRPGMAGTFAEPGVQCEACHGPGSKHIPNPHARNIFVDLNGVRCVECHSRPFGSTSDVIGARGGFIENNQQAAELRASGGHAEFLCSYCHDPHLSTIYDRENGVINECTPCHTDQNLTLLHENKIFVYGDYTERLSCVSCHMPYATRGVINVPAELTSEQARVGDMRTHIFRINADIADYTAMFTADGSEVVRDAEGRAAVTVDFVCLRCHHGRGNAFELTVRSAADIALGIHEHGQTGQPNLQ